LCARRGYTLRECANRIRPSSLHVIILPTRTNYNWVADYKYELAFLDFSRYCE